MVGKGVKGRMFVVKRDGRQEVVHYDKITSRIQKLCYNLDMDFIDPPAITLKVMTALYPGITTLELDNFAAETSAAMTTIHPDYAILAARIAVSNLHKETKKSFSEVMNDLYNALDPITKKHSPMISKHHNDIIQKHSEKLDSAIIYNRDFSYNYFGFKTLEKSYLLKINGKIAERPAHMLMRVAVGVHEEDIDRVIETYNYLSERYFTLDSPALSSACTPRQQMSSCFLLTMSDDSIEGIYDTLHRCAVVSQAAGGVGLNIHCIRAKGTRIAGTNGVSNGLVPMLRVFDNTARFVEQGGSEKPGDFAVYLEPWHADVFEFLDLKKNTGKEEYRARELLYALWIPDLFMKRVRSDSSWSLMCPHECPGLSDTWGPEFEALYTSYENEKRFKRQVPARDLWASILMSQVETGTPHMLYKDHCNRKSNQQNLGTIKCSNLSTEIIEYSSPEEVAVCNLASIAVNMFVDPIKKTYDFKKLKEITKVVTRNLDRVIDVNNYPLEEARTSNLRHRPLGIGVQGLADAFLLMKYPFDSDKAQKLNLQIFETMYYGALEASCELAQEKGTYETYQGSPVSQGILQYDMWGRTPSDLWDWAQLKKKIAEHGVRNSLQLAATPSSSTAQILGNSEGIEPYTSNVYTRRVVSGEFQVVNQHLLKDLTERDLWDDAMKNLILESNGSIQNIADIPEDLKLLYRTVWEIPQRMVLKMAADRGCFIDQSQSVNVHMATPSTEELTSMHFFGWEAGLKTGMYFLKTPLSINDILPDVCLGRIFQFLPLRDKFRITAVCKRWEELSSLAWEEPKELNLSSGVLEELPPRARTLEGVERVLQKCGSHLESIETNPVPRLNGMLPLIARYCPKITSLEPSVDYQYWSGLYFPNLKSLSIYGRMGSLTVVPEEVFRALPKDTMIEINLYVDTTAEEPSHSLPYGVLSEFRQLEKLVFTNLIISSHDMTAISRMSTLKHVNLSFSTVPHQLPSFTSLENLEHLDLGEDSDVTEHTLIEIANTCKKLKKLSFRSLSVTDRGLSSLKSLPKLVNLSIFHNNHITDVPLGSFHNLIFLECFYCPNIRDHGIIELLRNAPNFEGFEIRGTGVTQKVVEVANEVAKRRTNNCILELALDLSSLDWPCVDERAPLLYVHIYSGDSSKSYT